MLWKAGTQIKMIKKEDNKIDNKERNSSNSNNNNNNNKISMPAEHFLKHEYFLIALIKVYSK